MRNLYRLVLLEDVNDLVALTYGLHRRANPDPRGWVPYSIKPDPDWPISKPKARLKPEACLSASFAVVLGRNIGISLKVLDK